MMTTGERNLILNDQNISGRNFRFFACAGNKRCWCVITYLRLLLRYYYLLYYYYYYYYTGQCWMEV
jgi:hypothetical protein